MRIRELENWPPAWVSFGPHYPALEVGTLSEARLKQDSIRLTIEYKGNDADGTLAIEDHTLREKVFAVLTQNIGSKISAVGSLEIGGTH